MTNKTELLPCQTLKSLSQTRHGHSSRQINGEKESPTYRSWLAMRTRCQRAGRDNSDRYQEIGITVCPRWESFDNFLSDMGVRPKGMTLDRYPDRSGNYDPSNCRWATPKEQARNTRRSKLTLETATQVAVMRLAGDRCTAIAQMFGISESLPREIIRGSCWPDALAEAKILMGAQYERP